MQRNSAVLRYFLYAEKAGFHGRDGNRLAPQEAVTRAEVAAMVERLLKKSNLI
ncbi:hypothetical protein GZH47_21905 [Paenibacillus rhizovicinus]|uniref:S-layer homology domain-containing protein n=1 Tax=Paenibacillus rhizovicinus TaxID=2704463 RepID=A0A6C0P407_9BACL|nr:hypothetical protein [Paenibacillus rhizovicinus]QHW33175.1 hypothetical protein GZH47_21905 [Paenibacillus rhizovicinus]